MKKLLFTGLLLTGFLVGNAQTIRLTSATPNTTTLGGNNSLVLGTAAGNSSFSGEYNVLNGYQAGANLTSGDRNTFTGGLSGRKTTTGRKNTFYGYYSGYEHTTGTQNSFFGYGAGSLSTSGSNNSFFGNLAGNENTTGHSNTYIGNQAGRANAVGAYNTVIGHYAGHKYGGTKTGNYNVILGSLAGLNTGNGDNNVIIGYGAAQDVTISNKLYIANANANATPLIWGDFQESLLKLNAKVGIGDVSSYPTNSLYNNYKLFVTGGILTDEIRVKLSSSGTWADYVFQDDYQLPTLEEVENHIKENGHLPNVPSAKEVEENGINVADMARIQQEKIEELTLYIIELNKRIETLEAKTK